MLSYSTILPLQNPSSVVSIRLFLSEIYYVELRKFHKVVQFDITDTYFGKAASSRFKYNSTTKM